MRYVCVAGRAVRGDAAAKRKTLSRYAHDTYTMVRLLPLFSQVYSRLPKPMVAGIVIHVMDTKSGIC